MNKTQKLLKSREELFDEQFDSRFYGKPAEVLMNVEKVKSFHATTISLFLNSLKEYVNGKKVQEVSLPSDDPRVLMWKQKHNNTIQDISTLISETISNLQTK